MQYENTQEIVLEDFGGQSLDNHPQLRVGFIESGCGWLPYWLWRGDREYEDLRWEVGDRVKMKHSLRMVQDLRGARSPWNALVVSIEVLIRN